MKVAKFRLKESGGRLGVAQSALDQNLCGFWREGERLCKPFRGFEINRREKPAHELQFILTECEGPCKSGQNSVRCCLALG